MIPIVILSLWWLVWPLIGYLGLTRLGPVSELVLISSVVFVTGLFLGSAVNLKYSSCEIKVKSIDYNKINSILVPILSFGILLQSPTWYLLVVNIIDSGSVAHGRNMLFYGSEISKVNKLIFGFSAALIYNVFLAFSLASIHFYNKKKPIIIFLVFLVLSALLKGSRAEIYQFIAISLIFFISVRGYSLLAIARQYFKLSFFVFLSLFLILVIVSYLRGHSPFQGFLDYHVVGFVLLTKYMNDSISTVLQQQFTYGISFFSGIDYLVGLLAKYLFFPDILTFSKIAMQTEGVFYPTFTYGAEVGGGAIDYSQSGHNAFFTLLISGFKSFGFYGIPILGLVLGYFLSNFYKASKKGDVQASFYFIALLSCVFMGVFSSSLDTPGFWMTLMLYKALFIVINSLEKKS